MNPLRPLLYLWALPTTMIGLAATTLTLLTGGKARWHTGVLETWGGFSTWLLKRLVPLPDGASAMTLGHVVIARDPEAHTRTRAHERIHVRQCERWGPFFLPAYLAGSLIALARTGRPYEDNPFEREAYGRE